MDKQSLLGLGLITAILGVWLYFSGPSKEQIARNKQIKDSVELAQRKTAQAEAAKIAATIESRPESTLTAAVAVPDSVINRERQKTFRDFYPATQGTTEEFQIENDVLRLTISTKGGQIKKAELKDYKRAKDERPLILFEGDSTNFSLRLKAYENAQVFSTDSFYFKVIKKEAAACVVRLETAKPGSFIEFSYSLNPGEYLVKSAVRMSAMQSILNGLEDQIQLNWKMQNPSQEEHVELERKANSIFYNQENVGTNNVDPLKDEEKELSDADVKWISFKQQFFNASIIADSKFTKAGSFVHQGQRPESDKVATQNSAELGIPYNHSADEQFKYSFYLGPNHFYTLKKYDVGLEEIIPMGWSVFSYINKWMVVPLFNWLSFLNMGIVILILTIVVKIVLLPIAYKTYMSGAKMRVLKPETDALNAKFEKNADPMKKQQEQMALYRKAGVNPLSGCLPLLLQFPILIALFSFVPAAIELRQKTFLWAHDLSTYDSIWDFGYVPFVNWAYGDHVSLFAMLMFVSTLAYTYMNSSMMPQQNNQMPGMKFMMYFMPVIFLAVMNTYAAGLSWYYFLANMFTFIQNWVIKKIVSDEKIRAQLEANMKKPAKVSNFQKRLEEMAKQQQQKSVKKR
ncbi:MAG: membrane protein insertase YidC [Sphingobacteriia bacterium]|nr:membrane protein insertase YidC [Sphingobacteriia bacterium]